MLRRAGTSGGAGTRLATYPNKDALNEALDVYVDAMRPFVHRVMRGVRGMTAADALADALNDLARDRFRDALARGESVEGAIDGNDFPHIVNRRWAEFGAGFGNDRSVINLMWVIRDARNRAAHRGDRDADASYALARLTDVADVLRRIGRAEDAQRVLAIRDAVGAAPPPAGDAAPPAGAARAGGRAGNGGRAAGLKPWREAARPNGDVMEGTFREAEFAADLQQVHDGRAASEYGNPVAFFERTYVTPGMRTLLDNALRRIAGRGGDPVIQAKTGFGGGKTHSLIALYHLTAHAAAVTGSSDDALADVRALAAEAGLGDGEAAAGVAVLDCTSLSPTTPAVTDGGDPRNTLWGEMAWQLGGQEGYDLVGAAARGGTAPGGAELDALLAHAGPCVILIDELVAYARNVREGRDSVYTFVDNLTRAVRRSDRAVLVVTLPEHDAEAGDVAGAEALAALDAILGRIEAIWEPLETGEAFEVVRRRLFGVIDEAERDRTCRAFADMYRRGARDYPPHAREQRYLDRMKQCYPIHPEIFDRLYESWSSIPRFQRTRQVLRILANCVSRLYSRGDAAPLILPGHLPLGDPAVGGEFLPLLDGQWHPVLSEADGDDSRTDAIDRENQRFREIGAARRIARAVFLGSAPSGAVRGIDARAVRLAAVEPGHGVAAYNEALARMSGNLYYLYDDGVRYWFHAEENLNKVAADRIGEIADRDVAAAVEAELREAVGRRADAVVCPPDSAAVPDDGALRLVVLPPSAPLPSRASEADEADAAAQGMLAQRGDAPRVHRNALLFLAARNDELRALRAAVRSRLAWTSIVDGPRRIEGLEGERAAQARAHVESASDAVEEGVVRAWRWALAPSQPDPQRAGYRLAAHETDAGASGDIARAALDRLAREEALVDEMAPRALASLLRQYVWRGDAGTDHVALTELRAMFTSHVWLPRLRGPGVLAECVRKGVEDGAFGWAGDYDAEASRYPGLRFGEPLAAGWDAASGLLVDPDMAQLQREVEAAEAPAPPGGAPAPAASGARVAEAPAALDAAAAPPARRGPRRITATAAMSGDISIDEARRLSDEIVRPLAADGAEIEITITVTARKPDGFSEHAARAARENGVQLGLDLDVGEEGED